ncbi:MAG: hypothetical protein AAGA71_01630 [Pseudomonadota bacterium]
MRPEIYTEDRVTTVVFGCFGAQAVLCGLIMLLSRFTPVTFLVLGFVGSVPFFWFNYQFVYVEEIFTRWMLLDFIGNVAILTLCAMGYFGMKRQGLKTT